MEKLETVLEKFQNGEQRYDADPIFRSIITPLEKGLGVYAVLDRLIKEHSSLVRTVEHERATARAIEFKTLKVRAELSQEEFKADPGFHRRAICIDALRAMSLEDRGKVFNVSAEEFDGRVILECKVKIQI